MDSVNDKAQAAIKLTRADAVKLVAAEMIELAAHDVASCEQRITRCRDQFRDAVVGRARELYWRMLTDVLKIVGATHESLHGRCTYRVYEDGSDSGPSAQIIFSDHQRTYEAHFRITVSLQLGATELDLAKQWRQAMVSLAAAEKRDLRVGAMKKEARDLLVKAALADSPEGEAVVQSVKALAKSLKDKA